MAEWGTKRRSLSVTNTNWWNPGREQASKKQSQKGKNTIGSAAIFSPSQPISFVSPWAKHLKLKAIFVFSRKMTGIRNEISLNSQYTAKFLWAFWWINRSWKSNGWQSYFPYYTCFRPFFLQKTPKNLVMILGIFRVLSTDDVISTAVSYTGLSLTKCRRRQNAEDEKKSLIQQVSEFIVVSNMKISLPMLSRKLEIFYNTVSCQITMIFNDFWWSGDLKWRRNSTEFSFYKKVCISIQSEFVCFLIWKNVDQCCEESLYFSTNSCHVRFFYGGEILDPINHIIWEIVTVG